MVANERADVRSPTHSRNQPLLQKQLSHTLTQVALITETTISPSWPKTEVVSTRNIYHLIILAFAQTRRQAAPVHSAASLTTAFVVRRCDCFKKKMSSRTLHLSSYLTRCLTFYDVMCISILPCWTRLTKIYDLLWQLKTKYFYS